MSNIPFHTEDIIALVEHVSYKKTEGKFYLMTERLGWMTNTSDSFKISEHYFKVRNQRISPDDKEKVQLQLIMHSSASLTFQFTNPAGRVKQIEDRDIIKNGLQRLLPQFKEKANTELQTKIEWCKSNPKIIELYRELVCNKYLCREEFWERTAKIINEQMINDQFSTYLRGIPSYLLSSSPNFHYNEELNLSKQMIKDIFTVYPAVKIIYDREVPKLRTEQQFWGKFYQSHYFHLFRTDLRDDLFRDGVKYDVKQINKALIKLKKENQLKILSKADEVGEIFDEEPLKNKDEHKHTKTSSQEMIWRVNRKSIFILKTMESKSDKKRQNSDNDCDLDHVIKKQRLCDSIKDLTNEENTALSLGNNIQLNYITFNRSRVVEYTNQMNNQILNDGDDIPNKHSKLDSLKRSIFKNNRSLISSSESMDVLTDIGHLFSNTDLFKANNVSVNLNKVPPEMIRDLKLLYQSSSELFLQFWQCFPICNSAQFEKLHRIYESVKRFQSSKINGFIQQYPNYYLLTGSMDHKVIDHLNKKVDKIIEAYQRYLFNYKEIHKSLLQ